MTANPAHTALWPAPHASGAVDATVHVPGSKSVTNRALVLAALASEPGWLRRPLRSRDTLLMAGALRAMGVGIEETVASSSTVAAGPDASGEAWRVIPSGLQGPATVDVGNATVMRFLPPVAALADGPIRFDGDPRSYERPLNGVIDALRLLGARIDDDGRGALPLTVHGGGALDGGPVEIDASSSSQFVSALLLSGPRFNQGVEVRHIGSTLPSMPHIRMTVDMLRAVGAQVDTPESGGEPNVWRVTPGALLGRDLIIEPDLSNAQPFLAAALVTGGTVVIPDWPSHTTQPGDRLREIFTEMGGSCELTESGLEFTGSGAIHGIDVDLSEVGELTPGIAAVAALADSPSTLRGWPICACTRRTGWPRSPRRSTNSAVTSPRPPTGCTSARADCTAASSTPTTTTAWRPPARSSGWRWRASRSRTWRRRPRPCRTSLTCGPECSGTDGRTGIMRRYGKNTDEDDIRQRPNRKGNRPRTNIRPKHEEAVEGMVVTVDRGRLTCLVEDRLVMAMKARELGRKAAVVGDHVAIVGDLSGEKDTLARIVRIEPRSSVLRRTADDDDPYERVVVANADQLAIVTALADPEPRPRLIDRCLVAAYDAGLEPLLVLTKSDLAPPDELLELYGALGVPYVVTSRAELESGAAVDRVRKQLDGKITAFVGHSGVGKTTLVNALVSQERRRSTGHVNAVTGRGKHHDLGARDPAAGQ